MTQGTPELDRKGLEAAWEQAEGWCGQSGAIPDWFTNAILAYRRASEGASLATVGEETAQEYYARGYGLRCRVTDYLNSTMSKNAFRAAFLEWEACSGTKFLPSPDSRRASEGASLATAWPVLKGIGKITGDGWKDTTKIGEVVFVWNAEHPLPHAPGQYPRIGYEHWSASTEQYDFTPATLDEIRECFAVLRPVPGEAAERGPCIPVTYCALATSTHVPVGSEEEHCDLCGHPAQPAALRPVPVSGASLATVGEETEKLVDTVYDILWPIQEWELDPQVCRAASEAVVRALRPVRPGEAAGGEEYYCSFCDVRFAGRSVCPSCRSNNHASRLAFPPAPVGVLVKQLDWIATGQTGFLKCQHYAVAGRLRHTVHPLEDEEGPFFEHYSIEERDDEWHLRYWVGNNGLSGISGVFESLDAAKAAAQADYERRILSALSPATSPDRGCGLATSPSSLEHDAPASGGPHERGGECEATVERPDWPKIYDSIAHEPDRDSELLTITRETARLALSAINGQNERDYYHNFGAAANELRRVVGK